MPHEYSEFSETPRPDRDPRDSTSGNVVSMSPSNAQAHCLQQIVDPNELRALSASLEVQIPAISGEVSVDNLDELVPRGQPSTATDSCHKSNLN